MEYKNYTAKAIKDLERDLALSIVTNTGDEKAIQLTCDLLRGGQKFQVPVNGSYFDDGLKGLKGSLLRLPYPVTILEYDVESSSPILTGTLKSSKRIVLAQEGTIGSFFRKYAEVTGFKAIDFEAEEEAILVHAISYIDDFGRWMPVFGGLLIPRLWEGDQHKCRTSVESASVKNTPVSRAYPLAILPSIVAASITNGKSFEDLIDGIFTDTSNEVYALLEFLEALSCSNVSIENVRQVKPSVIKKREKQGKLPLYDFHYLSIGGERPRNTGGSSTSRPHASPRQHLRRGHIRRLKSGEKIWVNSCIVGSVGKVDKVYKLSRR